MRGAPAGPFGGTPSGCLDLVLPMDRNARFESLVAPAQPLVEPLASSELHSPSQRALPDDCDPPSGVEKIVLISSVPFHIGMELGLPEFCASGWSGRMRTPGVTVPKAAVHEAHGSKSTKHEIRRTGKSAVVQAVP